jgi:hypothetical protein
MSRLISNASKVIPIWSNKFNMISDYKTATLVVHELLSGMTLDSIRASGVLIELELFRANALLTSQPVSVKIEITGDLRTYSVNQEASATENSDANFFIRRATAVSELYLLIGQDITSARVSSLNALEIVFEDRLLVAKMGIENFEEIWSVNAGMPSHDDVRKWFIMLDDTNTLHVIAPSC